VLCVSLNSRLESNTEEKRRRLSETQISWNRRGLLALAGAGPASKLTVCQLFRRRYPGGHARPFEGYPGPDLGAVTPFLSTFGDSCLRFPKILQEVDV